MGKPNVLMLGWEFPPVFTGGLGIACFNIVKALSPSANIHLVVPFAESLQNRGDFTVTGLNNPGRELELEELSLEEREFLFRKISRVPVMLSAYPLLSEIQYAYAHQPEQSTPPSESFSNWADVSRYFFSTRDIYGADIHARTHLFADAVKHIARNEDFDVIYAHDWPTFRAAVALKRQSRKPLVLHVHALETDRAGFEIRNSIYHLEKQTMEKADKVIAVSKYTKSQIVSRYDIDESKVAVVQNGAEETEQSFFRKKSGEKWITFVGRITSQKGPLFLVETASKLVKRCTEARFVVAGQGDLFPFLVQEVAKRRLGKYFIFTGFLSRNKINDLLASSDAYFMPSVSEPFGLSAIEAVQQGAVCVISSRSGAAEVLANSLKADFWDTDSFANYLYALLNYPALKNWMRREAVRDVQDLTWGRAAEQINKVYDELINQ